MKQTATARDAARFQDAGNLAGARLIERRDHAAGASIRSVTVSRSRRGT